MNHIEKKIEIGKTMQFSLEEDLESENIKTQGLKFSKKIYSSTCSWNSHLQIQINLY